MHERLEVQQSIFFSLMIATEENLPTERAEEQEQTIELKWTPWLDGLADIRGIRAGAASG